MVLNNEQRVPSSLGGLALYPITASNRRYNNLKAICSHIQVREEMGMDLDLEYTISLIQLRIKPDNLLHDMGKGTFNNIIKDLVKESEELSGYSEPQMKHWLAWGSHLVDLSGAGEFFY